MSAHTPGPWIYDRNQETLTGSDGSRVMTLGDCYPNGGDPNEWDAKLIESSPEMLAVLERIASSEFEPMSAAGDWGGITLDAKDWNSIKAVIAKARGQS